MAWDMPTARTVKSTFAVLADVMDDVVEAALPLAEANVTQNLPSQVVYTEAASLYTAHILTQRGHGCGTEAELVRSGAANMQSVSDGSVSFTRKTSEKKDSLHSTSFGQQYAELIGRHVVPFTVGGQTL